MFPTISQNLAKSSVANSLEKVIKIFFLFENKKVFSYQDQSMRVHA